jgi:hypothetical protein
MSRPRLVPDDRTLSRLFARYPEESAQWFIDRFGWSVSQGAVFAHRRRLLSVNPILGAASISHAEFRRCCDEAARERHWAVTGVDR